MRGDRPTQLSIFPKVSMYVLYKLCAQVTLPKSGLG